MARIDKPSAGLLIPHARTTHAALSASSAYTEAGPRPGAAVASDALSRATVHAEGEQGAEVVVVGTDPARFAYRLGTESSGAERGYDTPGLMTGAGAVIYASGANRQYHDSVTIPDGRVLVMYSTGSTPGAAIFDPSDRSVTTLSPTWDGTSAFSTDHLALTIRPDGRAFLILNSEVWTSTDYTAWTLRGRTPYGASAPSGQRVVVYTPAGFLLVAWSGTTYEQWASTDGAAWVQVETVASVGSDWDAAALPDGSILVTYLEDTTTDLEVKRIGTAWSKLSAAESVRIKQPATAHYTAAICTYADGRAVAVYTDSSNGITNSALSTDYGATWTEYDQAPVYFGAAQVYFKNARAVVADGSVVVTSQHASNVATTSGVWWLTLGGWSQVTLGATSGVLNETARGGYGTTTGRTFIPLELPHTSAVWTRTSVGGSSSVVGGVLRIVASGGANREYWTRGSLGAFANSDAQWAIESFSGPSSPTSTKGAIVTITAADGSDEYKVTIRIGTAQYVVYDDVAGSTLATVVVSSATGLEWRATITGGEVSVWHRAPGATIWTVGADAVTCTSDTGSPAASSSLVWGAMGQCSQLDWAWIQGSKPTTATMYYTGETALGRELPPVGRGVAIPDAGTSAGRLKLSASGGSGLARQSWTLSPSHDYPLSAAFPEVAPSPRTGWRQTGTTAIELIWDLSAATRIGRCVALYVGRTNVPIWTLDTSTDGASWTTRGTLDLTTGWSGLSYTLTGDQLAPAAGSTGAHVLGRGDLIDGYARFVGGEVRQIAACDVGVWDASASLTTRLRLSDVDGTEAGATVALQWHSGAIVVYLTAAGEPEARYWRVSAAASQTIPDTDTGYHAGAIVLGEVVPFGDRLARGWSETRRQRYRATVDDRGSQQRAQLGPPQRVWTLDHGVQITKLDATDPDYWAEATDPALALSDGAWDALAGALTDTGAGALPVVAIKAMPSASDTEITDPRRILYGFATGDIRLDHVSSPADETSGRLVHRVSRLEIEESI